MIYLDNAATTFKKPKCVINSMKWQLKNANANPGRSGHAASLKTAEVVFNCRGKVREFFNAKDLDKVIFTKNCTEALNIVIKGVLKPNEHVVISSFEHNSVVRPLEHLKNLNITYSVAKPKSLKKEDIIKSFESEIKSNTKMIICTHASNVFGNIMPIKEIGNICKANNILFCVDAAQTAGVIKTDIIENNIDYLCTAGHKGLLGPMGTGILIINSKFIPNSFLQGGTGSLSLIKEQPEILPDKFESGTLNVTGIAGLLAGLNFINKITLKMIHSYEIELLEFLYYRLKKIENVILYTESPIVENCAPVLSFSVKGINSEDVANVLNSEFKIAVRAGLHCAPLAHEYMGTAQFGTVRVAPSYFNTKQEIKKLAEAVKVISAL